MILRIIGDIHGDYDNYRAILSGRDGHGPADYSIQLGDFCGSYKLPDIDPSRHKIFGGNHDNYDQLRASKRNLGDFGVIDFIPHLRAKIFFVRGAWSIDRNYRKVDSREELTALQCGEAIRAYSDYRPDILLSHDAPFFIYDRLDLSIDFARHMGFDTNLIESITSVTLGEMISIHRPSEYLFGHHHKKYNEKIGNTNFTCLTSFSRGASAHEYVDFEV